MVNKDLVVFCEVVDAQLNEMKCGVIDWAKNEEVGKYFERDIVAAVMLQRMIMAARNWLLWADREMLIMERDEGGIFRIGNTQLTKEPFMMDLAWIGVNVMRDIVKYKMGGDNMMTLEQCKIIWKKWKRGELK